MPQESVKSELPGRQEPVVNSRRGDTSAESLPGESRRREAPAADPMTDLSVTQAAEMLAQRRQVKNPPLATDEQPPVSDSEQPLADSEELELDDGESLEPDTDTELLDSDNGDDPDTEQPAEPEEESAQPQTVFVAGQDLTVPEIEDGFMRQDDYTRKTQQVAEREQQVDQREEYFASRLGQIDGVLRNEMAQFERINWAQLASQDMQKYAVVKAQADEAQRRYNAHQAGVDDFFKKVEARKEDEYNKKVATTTAELTRAFKGQWNNAKYYDLVDFMSSNFGVTREDVLARTDPLLFRLAAEAQAFRGAKRVKPVSKVSRSGKRVLSSRGTTADGKQATQRTGTQRKADSAMSTLKGAGTVAAAADAFAARRQKHARRT